MQLIFFLLLRLLKIRPVRLGVRTSGFHPGNRGSIPLRATDRSREALISKAFWQGFRFESGTEEERNTPNNITLHFIRYQCVYHDFGFHF